MHELSIVESIVETADRFARANDIPKVKRVTVQVGVLTGVVPQYLLTYYPSVAENTRLEQSELVIEEIQAEAFCRGCGEVFDPVAYSECPKCGKANMDIISGKELTVKELGYV